MEVGVEGMEEAAEEGMVVVEERCHGGWCAHLWCRVGVVP
jgi:hypothetical protein